MDTEYDVVIIGSGPGGYVAAIRAGQLGLKTAVVERDELGGICLNWGCIPSKALLKNAEILNLFRRGEEFGVSYKDLHFDFGKAIDRSRQVVQRLTRGVAYLLRKNKVEHIKGEGHLSDTHTVEVSNGSVLKTKHVILATGARPRSIPSLPLDGKVVYTSREALEMKQLPASVAIVGGGAVGAEFAYLYNAYGVQVTIIEMLPHLLPNEDEEISQHLENAFPKQGIKIITGAKVTSMAPVDGGVALRMQTPKGETAVACQKVLVAVGVQANTEKLGLENVGVATEHGFVKVDESMKTNIQGLYAIGDVTGIMPLAHVASAQGVMVVEQIAGQESPPLEYVNMPRAVYCLPQVASFGLTEKQARERGIEVKVGMFPFQAIGKAIAIGETEGMVKLVTDAKTGAIVGAHMIGPEVTELLSEVSMTKMLEGTTVELGWQVHPHPSLSEALKEAALAAQGAAIHI